MKTKLDFSSIVRPTTTEYAEVLKGEYVRVVSRKIVLSIRYIFALGYSHPGLYQETFGFSTHHRPFNDSQKNVFIAKEAMAFEKQEILNKLKSDHKYLFAIADQCEKDTGQLEKYSQELSRKAYAELSDVELSKLVQTLFEQMTSVSAYLLFPISIQSFLEKNIQDELAKHSLDEEIKQRYYAALVTPDKQNKGYFEQVAIMELASMYAAGKSDSSDFRKKLEEYVSEFSSQGVKYGYGQRWTEEEVLSRVKSLASGSDVAVRLTRLEALPKNTEKELEAIFQALKASAEFKEKVSWARRYVFVRTLRTDTLSAAFANSFPLFEEVAKRKKLDFPDVIQCSPDELVSLKLPSSRFIRERAESNIVLGMGGSLFYQNGTDAQETIKILTKKTEKDVPTSDHKDDQTLKGNTACKGKVTGVVKVVLDNSEIKKVKEGDILVAVMTTPDFVPAMEKAAAFVTDEGGLLCHAAIIAREMNKPCIIGTSNATKVLRDGMTVIVNADSGEISVQ